MPLRPRLVRGVAPLQVLTVSKDPFKYHLIIGRSELYLEYCTLSQRQFSKHAAQPSIILYGQVQGILQGNSI